MFIRSKGWGILGLLPLVVGLINFDAAARWGFQHRGVGPRDGLAMMAFAAGFWWFGRFLNRRATSASESQPEGSCWWGRCARRREAAVPLLD
jgi:hypothetical protein